MKEQRIKKLSSRFLHTLWPALVCIVATGCGNGDGNLSRDHSASDASMDADTGSNIDSAVDARIDVVTGANTDSAADASTTPDGKTEDASYVAPTENPDTPWTEADCTHPKVETSCRDGWCSIPAGCFIIGAGEGEFGRAMYEENQVPVTLTRPFLMQQTMFTYGNWSALGLRIPEIDDDGDCREQTCPLANITLFEAWKLANLLSEKHTPPLQQCYKISGCHGEMGRGMVCGSIEHTTPTLYECDGFRLPSEFEWEYAARAGTRTPFYSGDFAPEATYQTAQNCDGEKNIDPIAWYCANSGGKTHPVGKKAPNQWGLYDMIGNMLEWTNDDEKVRGYDPGALVDPGGKLVQNERRRTRGGDWNTWPAILRVSFPFPVRWDTRGSGVRLVRTGTENPGPLQSAPLIIEKAKKGKPKGKT